MTGASIEVTLEFWASSLRDVKGRMRPPTPLLRIAVAPVGFTRSRLAVEVIVKLRRQDPVSQSLLQLVDKPILGEDGPWVTSRKQLIQCVLLDDHARPPSASLRPRNTKSRTVPTKQPKRSRLWLNDASCVRLRPEHANHVWSYDFVEDRTHDGRKIRMLNVIDELTRECLAIRVDRRLKGADVIDVLSDLFILRRVPGHVRSDNGPEFVAKAVQAWITAVGAKTAYIAPGSPWENGYIESFNAKLRDELLSGEIFYTLKEARIVIEGWRRHDNTVRPHSSLGYRPPAPETPTWPWPPSGSASLHLRPAMAPEGTIH